MYALCISMTQYAFKINAFITVTYMKSPYVTHISLRLGSMGSSGVDACTFQHSATVCVTFFLIYSVEAITS